MNRWLAVATLALALVAPGFALDAQVTTDVTAAGIPMSPTLWGVFYEEINHAGDGGLYAELVQNRAFEEQQLPVGTKLVGNEVVSPKGFRHRVWYRGDLHAWSKVADGDADVTITRDDAQPLNDQTPHSLKLAVAKVGARAGVANEGFWGMNVQAGAFYELSFYARTAAGVNVTACLESAAGVSLAKATVAGVSGGWRRYKATLAATGSDPRARLVLSVDQPATVWFDVVSLFPQVTYKGRPGGLRSDIAQMLVDLKPSFVRFPGGCVVEGCTLENRIKWKNTIGDIAQRPGRWNLWGYHNTEGLGFHEYLQLCEDLGAEPLYVCHAGLSCLYRHAEIVKTAEDLAPYVQDVMDALEYANGPADSKWGAERARNGHPAPFGIKYVEIGNENWGADYHRNYKIIFDAIKAKYPTITTMADERVPGATNEFVDEHYYTTPAWMMSNGHKYDNYPRDGFKVYVGEYASNQQSGKGNLIAALGESVFMMGMERNCDVVRFASYAPLLMNVHDRAWPVNLIGFDSSRVYGIPSYHVQKLFAHHRPSTVLPTSVVERQTEGKPQPPASGGIGIGTWNTAAEFKDLKVTQGEQVLWTADVSKGADGWRRIDGDWKSVDGALRQSSEAPNCFLHVGDANWSNYTFSLKARKLRGAEGFLVGTLVKDADNWVWWNLGGWGNSRTAIEQSRGGAKSELGQSVGVKIDTNRWYDIRVEVRGNRMDCFLDGKRVQSVDLLKPTTAKLDSTVGYDAAAGQYIVKLVNPTPDLATVTVKLDGAKALANQAEVHTLTSGSPTDENTVDEPSKVVPVKSAMPIAGPSFGVEVKPYSLVIVRVSGKR